MLNTIQELRIWGVWILPAFALLSFFGMLLSLYLIWALIRTWSKRYETISGFYAKVFEQLDRIEEKLDKEKS